MNNLKIIKCLDCTIELSILYHNTKTTRCKNCQKIENKRKQVLWREDPEKSKRVKEQNKLNYIKWIKKDLITDKKLSVEDLITKTEYLKQNKPRLIAFLEAYEDKRYEDIDLLFCDEFIDYMSSFYFVAKLEQLSLVEQMNHFIIKIISEYSK